MALLCEPSTFAEATSNYGRALSMIHPRMNTIDTLDIEDASDAASVTIRGDGDSDNDMLSESDDDSALFVREVETRSVGDRGSQGGTKYEYSSPFAVEGLRYGETETKGQRERISQKTQVALDDPEISIIVSDVATGQNELFRLPVRALVFGPSKTLRAAYHESNGNPIHVQALPLHFRAYTLWLNQDMYMRVAPSHMIKGVASLVRQALSEDPAAGARWCGKCEANVYGHLHALWALGEQLACKHFAYDVWVAMGQEEEAVGRGCTCGEEEDEDFCGVDVDRQCGVELLQGRRWCPRSLNCSSHLEEAKLRVEGRSALLEQLRRRRTLASQVKRQKEWCAREGVSLEDFAEAWAQKL